MLELKQIKKDYKLKDQEPVHALKGISLNFRSNEFVAILGHSGCGKTTLLNITGGLDHYDDGDLIIKGRSTQNFTDRDWDTYRNHSVGFVFQSYNLISHQSLLKNVELALTIAGVSKEERTKRAISALDKVGLKGLYKKKPNQLSGGQMQRVAIARALVNNPEIVLADEPTGALDSETSVQIMELLKKVAKTHLVIMVTHNPELAEQYATRIVRMKDGLVVDDTKPFNSEAKKLSNLLKKKTTKQTKVKKKSSMSFFTALRLSFSNLFSKLSRTLLVSIAGSIGIIGVATILGVTCGVNNYIDNMEDDLLSSYPIQVTEQSLDMTGLLNGLSSQDKKDLEKFDTSTKLGLDSMIVYLMTKYSDITNVKTNDITEEFMQYIDEMPEGYCAAINKDYGIDVTNNIFTAFTKEKGQKEAPEIVSSNGLTQSYIKTLMTVKGFNQYASFVNIFTNFMKQLPGEETYTLSQYDLIAGTNFPTKENELLLVVDKKTTLTDLILAQMGFYPQDEFLNIAKKAVKSTEAYKNFINGYITENEYKALLKEYDEKYKYDTTFTFEDILNHDFYYFPHETLYKPNPDFVSHSNVTVSLTGAYNIPILLGKGNCILNLTYSPENDMLSGTMLMLDSNNKFKSNQTVMLYRDTPRDITKSVVDGKWSINYNGQSMELVINSSNKQSSGEREVTYDATGSLSMQGGLINLNLTTGGITEIEPETPDYYYHYAINSDGYDDPEDMLKNPEKYGGFKVKIASILRAKSETNFGSLQRGVYYTKAFSERFRTDAYNSSIVKEFSEHIENERFKESKFNAYVSFDYDDYTDDPGDDKPYVPPVNQGYASALNDEGGVSSLISMFIPQGMSMSLNSNFDKDKTHLRTLAGLKVKEVKKNPIFVYLGALSWSKNMYVYALDKQGSENAPYPGEKMDELALGIYQYDLPEQFNQVKFIEWDEEKKEERSFTSKLLEMKNATKIDTPYYDFPAAQWTSTILPHDEYTEYSEIAVPKGISFYPKNFDSKDSVTNYLARWNSDADLVIGGKVVTRDMRKDITVTDTISIIVTLISNLITAVSFALIAFTSLSLVVSCFMIAVITFISVMERIKEIGVIRSLGGRKKDVSRLFIAENLLTGAASGIIGLFFTYILQFILNAIVRPMGVPKICDLPWYFALMMFGISVLLSVLSGLIPSLKASKKDPVTALRSE